MSAASREGQGQGSNGGGVRRGLEEEKVELQKLHWEPLRAGQRSPTIADIREHLEGRGLARGHQQDRARSDDERFARRSFDVRSRQDPGGIHHDGDGRRERSPDRGAEERVLLSDLIEVGR